ncbi:hypothetical protein STBA_71740 [Streptomyces sp. MP131-18]|nr:hypothetical protein STBA_71740 [Streptomyces sp. MP131-18]
MNFADMTTDQFQAFITDMARPMPEAHRIAAEHAADMVIVLGAISPELRSAVIDGAVASVPAGRERLRAVWHVSQRTLRAAIAEGQGVPYTLIQAEARQRLAIDAMASEGLAAAEEAEAERIRLARESGWCTEYECRHRPTACAETCCWHCGRPNHRTAFSAAQPVDE